MTANINIKELQDLMLDLDCWPKEIYQKNGQWFMSPRSMMQVDACEISENAALSYAQDHAKSLMGNRWLFVLQNSKSNRCLICEKLLEPVSENTQEQPYNGGEVVINFRYGSRFDWLGARSPIVENGKIIDSKPVESMINSENRVNRLVACSDIKCIICDDCFEKKSHLFRGYEENKDGKLELVVE